MTKRRPATRKPHTPAFDERMIADVDTALTAASFGLRQLQHAYQIGRPVKGEEIDWALETAQKLGGMIADFEDGSGFGRIPLCMINQLRIEEDIASSLHKALITTPRKDAA